MAISILRSLDFNGLARLLNLPDATSDQEPVTLAQMKAAIEGLAWKDNARVSAPGNVNLAAPGAAIDGVAMSVGDRVLLPSQTTASQNGIYVWNGAATPMTRALDASTAAELESAVISIDEGTSAQTTFRQQSVNFTLDTDPVVFGSFGTSAPPASTTVSGTVEIATQGEVDAGTDTTRVVTPETLSASPWARRPFEADFGDGSATSFTITHNLNSLDVQVQIRETGGSRRLVSAEVQATTVNSVTILTDTVPAVNALRAVIRK